MSAFLRTASRAAARPTTAAAAARTFSSTAARPSARITIIGNLADTPEVRASSTGREYLRYAVASNTGSGENRKTSWFNVHCFAEGPRRDYYQSLQKGTLVAVQAEVTVTPYTDAEGKTRQGLNITHRELDVLRRPAHRETEGEGEHAQ